MSSPYEVHVLFEGYSKLLESTGMKANCSCTLITGGTHKILVDTMTAWDGDRIVEALAKQNISCSDITYVVCTHGHSDHIGNNNLFKSAKHIVGYSISEQGDYYHDPQFEDGEEYIIDEFVKVIPTPGHTLTCVTVLVKTKDDQLVAVAGDLFERQEDLKDETLWLEVAGSEDEDLQRGNRLKILKLADYIVPGHGPMFKVTEDMKKEACAELEKRKDGDMIEWKMDNLRAAITDRLSYEEGDDDDDDSEDDDTNLIIKEI